MSLEVTEALERYAKRVRETLRGGVTHIELALAPAFKTLVDELLPIIPMGAGLVTVPEYAQANVGRPDIALVRQGELPRAFIELKGPGKTLDPTRWRDPHDKRQFARFRELPTWALANFRGIQLYRRDEQEGQARIVPDRALEPETSDAKAAALIAGHDPDAFLEILRKLAAAQPPSPSNASQLAEYLAHAARLVRASVLERLGELAAAKEKSRPLQWSAMSFARCSMPIPRRAVTAVSSTPCSRPPSPRRSHSASCSSAKPPTSRWTRRLGITCRQNIH
ncbi:MAG TPA: hypothetical protein VMS43_05575 [Allosphingosinicella sp.]|nr:hypothetical protein [Allosphingosinicella sp.]